MIIKVISIKYSLFILNIVIMFINFFDIVWEFWNKIHPWLQLLISLWWFSLFAWILDLISLIIIKLTPKSKHKEYKKRLLLKLIKEWIIRIFKNSRKTVWFGLSYWFPKKDKKYTHVVRYYKAYLDPWFLDALRSDEYIVDYLDRDWETMYQSHKTFKTIKEVELWIDGLLESTEVIKSDTEWEYFYKYIYLNDHDTELLEELKK